MSDATGLDVAEAVAEQLLREAYRSDGRCTWIGATPDLARPGQVLERTLDHSLYEGLAGVGLFLGELAARTARSAYADTARATFAQAFLLAGRLRGPQVTSLYTGAIGVGLAALRVGALLDDGALRSRALTLITRVRGRLALQPENDLLVGLAGSILGLLSAHALGGDDSLVADAVRCADTLCARAQRGERGVAWPSTAARKGMALLGLSHGASGVALALVEAAQASGDDRHLSTAALAFAYEDSFLDPHAGWPDLRAPMPPLPPDAPIGYTAFWCHGAPGIGIARARARELTGTPLTGTALTTALDVTGATLESRLPTLDDLSLCHGVLGLVASLAATAPDRAARLGRRGIEAAARSLDTGEWPCGLAGWSPGLMLGTSGVGLACLYDVGPIAPVVPLPRAWRCGL